MTISIAFQTNKSLDDYGRLGRQIENYGFDGISVYNDMLYQPAWIPLTEIARATKRIRLGPAAVNPFTSHPINIAGNIALLDELSQGRAYLGLAKGAWLDFIGVEQKNPILTLKEAFSCITHLLAQSKRAFKSPIFPLAGGDSLRWKLYRPNIPFLLGTWGPKTITACIHHISEIKLGGTANPEIIPFFRKIISKARDTSQNDVSEIAIVLGAVTVVDEDGEKARERARQEVALYLPVIANLDPTLDLDQDMLANIKRATSVYKFTEAAEYIDDRLLAKFAFAGTPEEIVKQSLDVFEAGAQRVEFGTPHGLTPDIGLELLGTQVLPKLKEV